MRSILARAAGMSQQPDYLNPDVTKYSRPAGHPVPDATITVQLAPAPGALHPKLGKLTSTILAATATAPTSAEPGSPKSPMAGRASPFTAGTLSASFKEPYSRTLHEQHAQPTPLTTSQVTAPKPAVTSPTATTAHAATFSKSHNHTDVGAPVKAMLPQTNHSHELRASPSSAAAPTTVSTTPLAGGLADFEMGRVIGAGSFGRVSVARHRGTGVVYVIKALSKAACVQQGHVQHVLDEKGMLSRVSATCHPFFVTLHASFQDASCLYLVLDFVPGGDMFAFLRDLPRRTGAKLPEMHARFYAAQLVLALEHLHSRGIAYRDLKPENVLIDSDGYLKLGDFGFAKAVGQRGVTRSFCGTPDYLAPEVVFQRGHGVGVDWWALGCVIYEMLYGFPPFYGQGNHQETYRRITEHYTGAARLHYPDTWTPWVKDLISGLLAPEAPQRYGCGKGGVDAVKNHAWFQGLDWALVYKRMYIAPHRPAPPPAAPLTKGTAPTATSNPGAAVEGSASAAVTPQGASGAGSLDYLTGCFDDFAKLAPMKHPFTLSSDEQLLFTEF